MYDTSVAMRANALREKLPVPKGFKVLVAIAPVAEKTKGGIIRAENFKAAEDSASVLGFVLDMGPDAYKGTNFSESYCQPGDWVSFRSYTGTRFRMGDVEFRLINDNAIEAVVGNPEEFARV